jgi:hypothetical protein
MRSIKVFCFTASALMVAASACAAETTVVSDVLGAEGPLYVDGNLYYVGWISIRCRSGMARRSPFSTKPRIAATTDWR